VQKVRNAAPLAEMNDNKGLSWYHRFSAY